MSVDDALAQLSQNRPRQSVYLQLLRAKLLNLGTEGASCGVDEEGPVDPSAGVAVAVGSHQPLLVTEHQSSSSLDEDVRSGTSIGSDDNKGVLPQSSPQALSSRQVAYAASSYTSIEEDLTAGTDLAAAEIRRGSEAGWILQEESSPREDSESKRISWSDGEDQEDNEGTKTGSISAATSSETLFASPKDPAEFSVGSFAENEIGKETTMNPEES